MLVKIEKDNGQGRASALPGISIKAEGGAKVSNIRVGAAEYNDLPDEFACCERSRRRRFPMGLVFLFIVVFGVCAILSPKAHSSPLVPATGMTSGHPGRSSGLDCLSIKDNDARHYCLALAKHNKLECEFIRNSDLRAQCRGLADPKR